MTAPTAEEHVYHDWSLFGEHAESSKSRWQEKDGWKKWPLIENASIEFGWVKWGIKIDRNGTDTSTLHELPCSFVMNFLQKSRDLILTNLCSFKL